MALRPSFSRPRAVRLTLGLALGALTAAAAASRAQTPQATTQPQAAPQFGGAYSTLGARRLKARRGRGN